MVKHFHTILSAFLLVLKGPSKKRVSRGHWGDHGQPAVRQPAELARAVEFFFAVFGRNTTILLAKKTPGIFFCILLLFFGDILSPK